jgi:hypothetical protein
MFACKTEGSLFHISKQSNFCIAYESWMCFNVIFLLHYYTIPLYHIIRYYVILSSVPICDAVEYKLIYRLKIKKNIDMFVVIGVNISC